MNDSPVLPSSDDKSKLREFFTQFQFAISRNAQEAFFVEQSIKKQQAKKLPVKQEDLDKEKQLNQFRQLVIFSRLESKPDDPISAIVASHPHSREVLQHIADAWSQNEKEYMQQMMEINETDKDKEKQIVRRYMDRQKQITDLTVEHFTWLNEWQRRTLPQQQKSSPDAKETPPWAKEYVQHYNQFLTSLTHLDKKERTLLERIESDGVPLSPKDWHPMDYQLTPAYDKIIEIGRKENDPEGLNRILQQGVLLRDVDKYAGQVLKVNAKTGTVFLNILDGSPDKGERLINTLGAHLGVLVPPDIAKQPGWMENNKKEGAVSVPGRGVIKTNAIIDYLLVDDKGVPTRILYGKPEGSSSPDHGLGIKKPMSPDVPTRPK